MFSLLGRSRAPAGPEAVAVGSNISNRDGPSDPTADATADALERGATDPRNGGPVCRDCFGDEPRCQSAAASCDPSSAGEHTAGLTQHKHICMHQPDEGEIYFRPLQETDREAIKSLHEEWFPVRYKEDFYDNVVRNQMAGSGDPLYSCVACVGGVADARTRRRGDGDGDGDGDDGVVGAGVLSPGMDEEEQWNQVAQSLGINFDADEKKDCVACMEPAFTTTGRDSEQIQRLRDDNEEFADDERGAAACQGAGASAAEGGEKIVGCVVGSFLDTKRCNKKSTELLAPNPERYGKMFYIMTLGTITEYRHRGLATRLIEKCIRLVESDPSCGVLYLHVITYNEAAIRFYEKMNFHRVEEIEDYYNIDDQHYNCYLYARYFHGNRGHFTLYYVVTNLISAVWRRVSAPVYFVLKSENGARQK